LVLKRKQRNPDLNETQTFFFLSDAHLGENAQDREIIKRQRLFSFFEHVKQSQGTLVICGDLFDFWFEYQHVIPKHHFQVLHQLKLLTDSGIKVHYLAGNHDLWIHGFLENELNIQVHPNEFISRIENKKLYVTHGDGLRKSDFGYRLLKRIMLHPVNIFLFRLFHPDFGIPFALLMSHQSRIAGPKTHNDMDYRKFAKSKIAEGFNFVVLGHTHLAMLQKIDKGWYINPGDWMFNFTFAKIEMGIPKLYTWDGSRSQPLDINP